MNFSSEKLFLAVGRDFDDEKYKLFLSVLMHSIALLIAASLCLFVFCVYFVFLTLFQDSEDDWVEAQPQTHSAKAWKVPDQPKAPEGDLSPTQNVQVCFIQGLDVKLDVLSLCHGVWIFVNLKALMFQCLSADHLFSSFYLIVFPSQREMNG